MLAQVDNWVGEELGEGQGGGVGRAEGSLLLSGPHLNNNEVTQRSHVGSSQKG